MPPMQGDLSQLTASDGARLIAERRLTASDWIEALLARFRAREPAVQAWAHLDEARAREAAAACDRTAPRGPLHGVPVGIKDVIDTADQPTQYNSPLYRGHRPAADAVAVARLRTAGAIILGKTVTTEFAYLRPGPTRNPHDLACTPGGSSSGSGAAVADRMVPAALGTQTGGSTIRPAAFCGVYGYKPAFELWDTRGIKYLAPSLDTIGLMTRSLDDIALISAVLAGLAAASPIEPGLPRLALFRPPNIGAATPAAVACLDEATGRIAAAGCPMRTLGPPPLFGPLDVAHRTIMAAEVARSFAAEWRDRRDGLSPEISGYIATGLAVAEADLAEAWGKLEGCKRWFMSAVAPDEIVLTLSAPGEAPTGIASTGEATFNRPWTLLHAACVNVPVGRGPRGLPLGVQLVSLWGDERRLLGAARWLERNICAGPVSVRG
jgi:amidase